MTEAHSEDEWRKRITAKFLQGSLTVCVDNVRAPLDSAALACALTESIVEDRVLGHSRMTTGPARRIWTFTGNNIQVSAEIRRRTVRIRMDPGVERPEARQAKLGVNLAGTQVAAARSSLLPEVELHTAFEADRQRFITRGGANWLASIGVRWNLFNGFADKSRISEAGYLAWRAAADQTKTESALRLQVRGQLLEFHSPAFVLKGESQR